jgi:hypothetical protein
MNKKIIDVSIVSWLLAASCAQKLQAAPVTGSQGALRQRAIIDNGGLSDADLKKLSAIEMSHFQRNFEVDPAAKRVKRIELLLAGAGQEGTLKERLNGLDELTKRPNGSQSASPSKYGASQSITQLELSINKKADPKLDALSRLANLEKKVFGSPFPNLSIQQRIARLQKTIGTGSNDDIADGMPGTLQQFGAMPHQFPPGIMINSPFMSPYSLQHDMSSDPNVNRHMSEMFDRLNQQLRQLHRPQGYGQPNPRQYSAPQSGYDFSDGLPPIPQEKIQKERTVLPPYMDPNSI